MAYREQVIFDCARKVLLAGVWLIENGHGRLVMLPYVYATGNWRCEFHVIGRPRKTALRWETMMPECDLTPRFPCRIMR